jgi:serine/threonine protein kinase
MGGMKMAAKKILCLTPSEREVKLKLCRQEFRALHRAQHKNIVKLIGVIVDDVKSLTLLMELAEGGSLRSLLIAHPQKVVGVLGTQRQLLRGINSSPRPEDRQRARVG